MRSFKTLNEKEVLGLALPVASLGRSNENLI
jgi:hypothetical protein